MSSWPPLDLLQQLYISHVLEASKLDTVLKMEPHEGKLLLDVAYEMLKLTERKRLKMD